jgi:hypothetical protein
MAPVVGTRTTTASVNPLEAMEAEYAKDDVLHEARPEKSRTV